MMVGRISSAWRIPPAPPLAAAGRIARLRSRIKAAPEIRVELVERLKAAIESGAYTPGARQVAERILQSKVLA